MRALKRETDGDYVMHPKATSFWVTIGGLSLYVLKRSPTSPCPSDEEQVEVRVFNRGKEGDDPIQEFVVGHIQYEVELHVEHEGAEGDDPEDPADLAGVYLCAFHASPFDADIAGIVIDAFERQYGPKPDGYDFSVVQDMFGEQTRWTKRGSQTNSVTILFNGGENDEVR